MNNDHPSKASGGISLKDFDRYIARVIKRNPKNDVKMTEVDHGDGTYSAVRPDGTVAAVYGEKFRAAIQKL